MLNVSIRGCLVGEGRPKVVVPIVERSANDILQRAAQLATMPIDIVEWRADWFESFSDSDALCRCLRDLRNKLGDIPLLFTFRTRAEGGEQALSHQEYIDLCRTVCSTRCVDLLDVEMLTAGEDVLSVIENAHRTELPVMCSSHNFNSTPSQAEMVRRMVQMQRMGADIAKLAVMPRTPGDVLALLAATTEMRQCHSTTPVVTMSMGALGSVSRLCGEVFGSSMTFASVDKQSAPGQFDLATLNAVLDSMRL
jgi:3-dehydroquinate dehydratase-1